MTKAVMSVMKNTPKVWFGFIFFRPDSVTAVFIYSDTFLAVFLWHVIMVVSVRQTIGLAFSHMSSSALTIFFSILKLPFNSGSVSSGSK